MSTLSRASIEPDEIVGFLKRNIQLREVYEKILQQSAIERVTRERGIAVTPEEIQDEAERQRRERRLEKASDTLAWLAAQKITPDDWEAGIRDRLLAQKLADHLFAKEVEKFFAQNRLDFDRVLLYQIIVTDFNLAQELFYQIEEREISFYEAAHLYDMDEKRRQQCGCEGKLDRWQFKPDIAAAVFGAPIGVAIGPLQTALGYHLFMVEEFIPAELTPQRYQDILDRIFKEWLTSELNYMLYSQVS
ncbi:MAG TPA: peptidylprolyl isomerase [Allocoleopsis sp.]